MNDHCKPFACATRHAFASSPVRRPRWKFSALAAALVACAGLHAPQALALTLGPVTVQSALGEPLRAEIDLAQITPAEAESLRASTAAADVFRTQGMEYSAIASQMRVQLHRRPDGRMVLRLSGNSPVNEPFVDLVIDARWSAGQVTRSYTMLFDPPAARRSPAPVAAATAPVLAPLESRPPALAARRAAVPAASSADNAGDAQSAASGSPGHTAAPVRNRAPAETGDASTLQVRSGDTASSIARARRPQGVSLDQMLVAMVRANPDAFVQGNVNRLKAGSVLQIPDQEQALATPTPQARELIAVQSRDFNDFRRRLAGAAPAAEQVPAQRSASGSVQTRTEDASAPAAASDKLTLSKGAMQGQKTTEEMLAERKQGNAAAARTQELAKNIEELNRLNAASGTAGTAAPAATTPAATPATAPADTSAAPGLAVANPGLVVPPNASAAALSAPAPGAATGADPALADASESAAAAAQASADSAAATQPASATSAAAATPAEPASESSGFMQDLLDQPALPLAAIALLLLLAYGGYRSMQRRRSQSPMDSGFADSKVQPDSFFGASGGQRVDTTHAGSSTIGATSQLYSHSQLDTGGEVDPVAEADVYLAYGRDLQAEEILREAARTNPTRVAIFVKLGEIYAKRLDRKALESMASDVHRLTQGKGAEWEQMVNLGRTLDPANKLYHPGGASAATVAGMAGMAAGAGALDSCSGTAPDSLPTVPQSRRADLDLDLDLDFDLPDDALTEAPGESRPGAFMPAAEPDIAHAKDQDWDALEDLVAFNAAIAAAPAAADPMARPGTPGQPQTEAFLDTDAAAMDASASSLAGSQSGADLQAAAAPAQDLHLEWEAPSMPAPLENRHSTRSEAETALDNFDLHLDLPALDSAPAADSANHRTGAAFSGTTTADFVSTSAGLMDFDFNDLSLDLDSPGTASDSPAPAAKDLDLDTVRGLVETNGHGTEDPLATKLSLAQEFHAIGDSEGARTLVEEVIAESSGTLKARARQLLAEMD